MGKMLQFKNHPQPAEPEITLVQEMAKLIWEIAATEALQRFGLILAFRSHGKRMLYLAWENVDAVSP